MAARLQTQPRPTELVGVILTLALLAALLQAGSPGFNLTDDGVWTLAKHFPKSTQQRIERKQKKGRGQKEARRQRREQAIPRNVDIPNLYLGLYTEYAGDDWNIVAGIYKIESDHGRSRAPGVRSGVNSFGCCAGPGQFNLGGTWQTWRRSPSDNVYDPRDSVPATVRMLRAYYRSPNDRTCSGALARKYGPDWTDAIMHYNNSCGYVNDVLTWAETYAKQGNKPESQAKIGKKPKGLTFTKVHGCNPARDWRRGAWTPEVRGFLLKMADKFSFRVSCGAEGHSQFVKGTNRQSAHWTGGAFDVDIINGVKVSPSTPMTEFGQQALDFGARQVGGPIQLCRQGNRCFTDAGHQGHWHIQP